MSLDDPLYIPIKLLALAVNDQVREGQAFQRWQANYRNLASFVSPVPAAFDGNSAASWNSTPRANGIYLQWVLPQALRRGKVDPKKNSTDFPLVPNRWLVVRYNGPLAERTAVAWVVEADFLDPDQGTSAYLKSDVPVQPTFIGRKAPLELWKESSTAPMFLTAVGAGDMTFSAYQPLNENVFSIHDPLTGVPDQDTLSYLVAGWYSDLAQDPLATAKDAQSFSAVLDSLGWQVETPETFSSFGIFHGLVHGISWNRTASAPPSDRPTNPSKVLVSVGNTSIDALTALIQNQASAQGKQAVVDSKLLEAFQYDLLPLLDRQDGAFLLDQAIKKAWFGNVPGGFAWVIVGKTGSGEGKDSQQSVVWDPTQPDWLQTLNENQRDYDRAVLDAQDLQWKLYALWWAQGRFQNLSSDNQQRLSGQNDQYSAESFRNSLDPSLSGSLAAQTRRQLNEVTRLAALIPQGDDPDSLAEAIAQFSSAHQISSDYQLKRYSKTPFSKPNDPVVLIHGGKVSDILTEKDALGCRSAEQVVTGFVFDSKTIGLSALTLPPLNLSNVPAGTARLVGEFFLLDPDNAVQIASQILKSTDPAIVQNLRDAIAASSGKVGKLPDLDLTNWGQPWSPLFMLWEILFYPIPYTSNSNPWSFDGSDFVWNGTSSGSQPLTFAGRTLLTPQSGFNFKSRLESFRDKHPDLDSQTLANLESFITQTDDWDFFSQTLDGLTHQMTLRDPQMNGLPTDSVLRGLIGSSGGEVPDLGNVPEPFEGWPDSNFLVTRSGQFCFRRLTIVDRFGQTLETTNTQTFQQFQPVVSEDMKPGKTVMPDEPCRFVELSPRLLQPARLAFDFVDALDDTRIVDLHTDVNPVCAWILPNHLDRSLQCFDPSGKILGDVRVLTDTSGESRIVWEPSPNSVFVTLDQLQGAFPHLSRFLTRLTVQGSAAFSAFYQTIDATLWVIDPLGDRDDQNLSVLVGRPLALTRTRLKFELAGPPLSDPSWEYVFSPSTSVAGLSFPIRLGEASMLDDGLIGYFLSSNYDAFNAVYSPPAGANFPPTNGYIVPVARGNFINLTFSGQDEVFATLLIDPRASVHGTAAIVPTVVLELPERFVQPALLNMEVEIHTGPILSQSENTTNETIQIPIPSEKNGTWSWLALEGATWKTYPIKSTDQTATFSDAPPVLRSGFLTLKNATIPSPVPKGE